MKHLSILRHAKAERPEGYGVDLDRPLTKRGLKDAARIGKLLAQADSSIDWILSSPAVRTRQTADALVAEMAKPPKIVWHDAIYDANVVALLDALRAVPSQAEHALLIGHNPGMEALTSALCTGSPDRLHVHMATASLALVRLEVHSWNQVRPGSGTLLALLRPSLLRS